MTNRKPIGVLLFAFTYGMEAIIPTEIGMPTLRTGIPENEAVTKDLNMIDKLREAAAVRITSYQ